jgi:hypothetical protein
LGGPIAVDAVAVKKVRPEVVLRRHELAAGAHLNVTSTEREINAAPNYDQRQRRGQQHLCAAAAGRMSFLVIKQPLGADKTHGCNHD